MAELHPHFAGLDRKNEAHKEQVSFLRDTYGGIPGHLASFIGRFEYRLQEHRGEIDRKFAELSANVQKTLLKIVPVVGFAADVSPLSALASWASIVLARLPYEAHEPATKSMTDEFVRFTLAREQHKRFETAAVSLTGEDDVVIKIAIAPKKPARLAAVARNLDKLGFEHFAAEMK